MASDPCHFGLTVLQCNHTRYTTSGTTARFECFRHPRNDQALVVPIYEAWLITQKAGSPPQAQHSTAQHSKVQARAQARGTAIDQMMHSFLIYC